MVAAAYAPTKKVEKIDDVQEDVEPTLTIMEPIGIGEIVFVMGRDGDWEVVNTRQENDDFMVHVEPFLEGEPMWVNALMCRKV
jgi:hypothetical protein